jgi:hypothetical protein
MIGHSLLHPTMTDEDLREGGEVAAKYKVASVCIKPYAVKEAGCVRIMTSAGYRGYFAVEYEEEGDGVVCSKQIMEEVLAAL